MDEEKLKGYIFGSAYGDALGQPVEFLSYKTIQEEYGKEGIQNIPEQAHITDDTEMMMALGKGLVRNTSTDLETLMNNVAQEFITWLDHPGIAPGGTCITAVRNLKEGADWKESGVKDSMGCGSAMRSGIIGMLYNDTEKVKTIAHNTGIITHGHKDADASAQGAALLVYYARNNVEIKDYPKLLLKDIGGISTHFTNLILRAEELSKKDSLNDVLALKKIGEGWVGSEAVAMALYLILKYRDDYLKVITTAVNITGDSDSIGAIAGGIVGARVGYSNLPNTWLKKLMEHKRLEQFVEDVLEKVPLVNNNL